MDQQRPVARVRFQELQLIAALLAMVFTYPGLYAAARATRVLIRWRHPGRPYDHYIGGHWDHDDCHLENAAERVFKPLRLAEQRAWSWIEER